MKEISENTKNLKLIVRNEMGFLEKHKANLITGKEKE